MRLLYLVHQFPPQFSTGTEVLALETARAQIAAGHQVEILTAELVDDQLQQGRPLRSEAWEGITVHRYPYFQARPDPSLNANRAEYVNPSLQVYLRDAIAAFRPDLVHAFHLYRISTEAVETVHTAGLPIVYSVTDFWSVCPVINLRLPDGRVCPGADRNSFNCLRHLGGTRVPGVMAYIPAFSVPLVALLLGLLPSERIRSGAAVMRRQDRLHRTMRRIDAIIVPSRIVKERLAPFGLSAERMHDLPFGLNFSYLENAPQRVATGRLRVGFIGSITQPKGLHVLARAFASLPASLPVDLHIHGRLTDDPAYAEAVREQLAGDPRVSFLGSFPNARIGEVLAVIDVLVVPSVWLENTPLVIGTAQAARVPVIATDLGGMSEVISHDVNGMLFPSGDHAALAVCIGRLLADPSLLPRYAASARIPKTIAQYAEGLVAIYAAAQRRCA